MSDRLNRQIEACAKIADEAAAELSVMLGSPASRKSQYDRQTALQMRYAQRWCRRIAMQIRKLKSNKATEAEAPRSEGALGLLGELRPLIAHSRESKWRRSILARIDTLCGNNNPDDD